MSQSRIAPWNTEWKRISKKLVLLAISLIVTGIRIEPIERNVIVSTSLSHTGKYQLYLRRIFSFSDWLMFNDEESRVFKIIANHQCFRYL